MDQETLVETRNLSRRYGLTMAVSDLNITLHKGEILALLGPNGAGKTTALRMLTGTLAPTSGSVSITGIDMAEQPKAAKARLGYLPERPPLHGELTVDEFLRYCSGLHGLSAGDRGGAMDHAKRACGLSHVGHRLIGNLSTGYQQRVGLAQAIIHNPDVVILDEPTVGLDPNQIREIRALIRQLGENHGVILSSHILPEVQAVCDRVMIINHGKVVFSESLRDAPDSQMTTLRVTLRHSPATHELSGLAGIHSVEDLGGGRFLLSLEVGADPREALVHAAVENGWGLLELRGETKSLEERFVELTSGEEPLEAAA